jgi:beta-lactamase superfamily II metal-dependent hydrolase
MINNLPQFSQSIWQRIFEIFLRFADAFYRVSVRLLYHSKIVGVLFVFSGVIFVTSISFYISVFNEAKTQSEVAQNNHQGFYVIDVGQGDSSLFITKENQTILTDTGRPGSGIVQKLDKLRQIKKDFQILLQLAQKRFLIIPIQLIYQ